jgi:hypothetical protein
MSKAKKQPTEEIKKMFRRNPSKSYGSRIFDTEKYRKTLNSLYG